MPKQVYVFPGNINDTDLTEGVRTVLEPAVDKVYTFDTATKGYVDANNTSTQAPDDVYLLTGSLYTYPSPNIKLHWTGAAPQTSDNKEFIPAFAQAGSPYGHAVIIKNDPASASGYTIVSTSGTLYSTNIDANVPAYIKILWDTTSSTTFIVIRDVVGYTTDSSTRNYATKHVVMLVTYDKAADTVTIVDSIDDSNLLKSFPIGNLMFYYDSGNDAYTFYMPYLTTNGGLFIRKITATQTAVTSTHEALSLTGSSTTPKFPDSVTNPYDVWAKSGLNIRRPWKELTQTLETDNSDYSIALLDSPNMDTESDIVNILKSLTVEFKRGTFSYDSGTSTWNFSVSSEFSLESIPKVVEDKSIKFLNNKKGISPAASLTTSSSDYTRKYLHHVEFDSICDAAQATDISGVFYTLDKGHADQSNSVYTVVAEFTYDTTSLPVLQDVSVPVYSNATSYKYFNAQLESSAPNPPIALLYIHNKLYIMPKVTTQNVADIVPTATKYIYDISLSSTKGNRFYVINRVTNSRHYPYVIKVQYLPGATRGIVAITDPAILNITPLDIMTYQEYDGYSSGMPALNYSAGGTITSVYTRDASGLESLAFWIRSGTTVYGTFVVHFERTFPTANILKYIHTNTNIDPIFVNRSRLLQMYEVGWITPIAYFTSTTRTSTSTDITHMRPAAPGVSMVLRPGGTRNYFYPNMYSIYYDPLQDTVTVNNNADANTTTLLPFVVFDKHPRVSGSEAYAYSYAYMSAASAVGTLFNNNLFIQVFKDSWSADYEDTIEVTVGPNIYKYVVIGKFVSNYTHQLTVVLEDIV